jgi:hypothetical protein
MYFREESIPSRPMSLENEDPAEVISRYVALLQSIQLSSKQATAMAGEMQAYWLSIDKLRNKLTSNDQPANFQKGLSACRAQARHETVDGHDR